MKNYNKHHLLNFITIIMFILTALFLYFLNTIKIWTYNSCNIIKIDKYKYQVIVDKKSYGLFTDNNYFFYNTKKYTYKITSNEKIDKEISLTLKVDNKISNERIETIMLPDTKETLFSLIINNWREKRKN